MRTREFAVVAGLLLLSGISCSDPVPPPARGTVQMRVMGGSTGACGVDHIVKLPADTTVSATSTGAERAIDDSKGARVTCRHSGNSFSGEISLDGELVNVRGSLDGTTTGNRLSHYSPKAANNMDSSDVGCTFTRLEGGEDVIWVQFSCERYVSAPSHICRATGVFAFEDCE